MAHTLIEWVIWHKCVITPAALLPCRCARANGAVCVPNAAETRSSGIAQRPLAEERNTPPACRLYYSTYWSISRPQLFRPIDKDTHHHRLSGSTESTTTVQNLSGTRRDTGTTTAYWQRSKGMSIPCRLSGNTAASPEPGFLRAVIHQHTTSPKAERWYRNTSHLKKAFFFPVYTG